MHRAFRTRTVNKEESSISLDPTYPRGVLGLVSKRIPTIRRCLIKWLLFFAIFSKSMKNQALSFHPTTILGYVENLNGSDLASGPTGIKISILKSELICEYLNIHDGSAVDINPNSCFGLSNHDQ